ncbi:hypothetical protein JCM11251_002349 [Rhodosporidiobolus azoricus]
MVAWTQDEEQALIDAVEAHPRFPALKERDYAKIAEELFNWGVDEDPGLTEARSTARVQYWRVKWVRQLELCPRCPKTHKFILAKWRPFQGDPKPPRGSPSRSDVEGARTALYQKRPSALRNLSCEHLPDPRLHALDDARDAEGGPGPAAPADEDEQREEEPDDGDLAWRRVRQPHPEVQVDPLLKTEEQEEPTEASSTSASSARPSKQTRTTSTASPPTSLTPSIETNTSAMFSLEDLRKKLRTAEDASAPLFVAADMNVVYQRILLGHGGSDDGDMKREE